MRNFVSKKAQTLKPSGIRKFFDLCAGSKDIISLGVGEPDFVTPWSIRDAAIQSIEDGQTQYTSNWGLLSLREEIAHYMETGELLPEPTPEERMAVLKKHINLLCKYKGEYTGMREARKHSSWYIKGMRGAAEFRRECGALETPEDLENLIDRDGVLKAKTEMLTLLNTELEDSMLNPVLYRLATITKKLIILTPHKRPKINSYWKLENEVMIDRVRLREYCPLI